jgi:BirA family biotin operon repressor/biotin-[acetyl-CoA-carboxylase] ligase
MTKNIPENILELYQSKSLQKIEISVFEKDKVRQNGIIKILTKWFLWIELENEGLQKFFTKK